MAVKVNEYYPSFAAMKQVESPGGDHISQSLGDKLGEEAEIIADGWLSYGRMNSCTIKGFHVVIGFGKNTIKVLLSYPDCRYQRYHSSCLSWCISVEISQSFVIGSTGDSVNPRYLIDSLIWKCTKLKGGD